MYMVRSPIPTWHNRAGKRRRSLSPKACSRQAMGVCGTTYSSCIKAVSTRRVVRWSPVLAGLLLIRSATSCGGICAQAPRRRKGWICAGNCLVRTELLFTAKFLGQLVHKAFGKFAIVHHRPVTESQRLACRDLDWLKRGDAGIQKRYVSGFMPARARIGWMVNHRGCYGFAAVQGDGMAVPISRRPVEFRLGCVRIRQCYFALGIGQVVLAILPATCHESGKCHLADRYVAIGRESKHEIENSRAVRFVDAGGSRFVENLFAFDVPVVVDGDLGGFGVRVQ